MKLTLALVFVILLQTKASIYAQRVSINVKNASVMEVLKGVKSQTNYDFLYDDEILTNARPISLRLTNAPIYEVLDKCFRGLNIEYTIVNTTVLIKSKRVFVKPSPLPFPISGSVTDNKGSPLQGVTVKIKNSGADTQTDLKGAYTITVPDSNAVLVFSSLGFATLERPVRGFTRLNIVLEPVATSLAEVAIVSIGYGTLDKREVTSAVTHISAAELLSVGGNNALMSLQGKVAGLSITNTQTANPNSGPSIQLRGVSSRNAGLGPLFLINGVPTDNIDNLNQNDIESIDVLKGGAASAIYGTRGSNGVIIITTKKGGDQSYAAYDGYATYDQPTNELSVLSAEEFLAHNRGTNFGGTTDWFKEVAKDKAISYKHTFSLSGGSAKTNYRLSLDYRNAEGLELRSSRKEYGGRLNLSHTSGNNLYAVNISIAPRFYKSANSAGGGFSQGLTLNPTYTVMDPANPIRYRNITVGFNGAYNPVEEANTILSGNEGKFMDWSGSFKLNLVKGLYTQITLGSQNNDNFGFGFTPSYNTALINSNGGRNLANRNYNKGEQKSLEWIGNYSRQFGDHDIKLLGGYSYNYFTGSSLSASNQGLPSDVLTYNNLGSGAYNLLVGVNGVGSSKDDSKLIGFFSRLNYDFGKKYFLSASVRKEGSSKFGYNHKWGYFPAASIGWRVNGEHFFPQVSWLDDLKLRADYGVTGNQNFGNYLSLDTYGGYGYYLYNGISYQVWGPSQNTNYDLRWERSVNFNAGLDFGMLNNRISGSFNYYIRTNKDLLGSYNVSVPPNVQTTTFVNVGTMKNSGFEIQLNGGVLSREKFKYDVSFSGATNANKFVSFSNDVYKGQAFQEMAGLPAPGSPGASQRLEEGRRIGSFFMLRSAGIDATGRLLVYDRTGNIIPGNRATVNDKQYVGNGLPQFTASMGHHFAYRNIDLSINLRGAFGYDLFNTAAFYLGTPVTQSGSNVLTSAYDGGKYSVLTNSETYSSLSDYFLEPGDFVKIDNITAGINLKSPVKYISSARVYLTGRNLYTFTKWTGGDPEYIQVNGLTPGINTSLSYYPSSLQILAGLQLRF
ncbi:SusC/RagA family TonB-linked outer membrane protein [Hufsiella ginkgonis]|nr:SusC/RagA family TonB-linked outer membrane protein [Hufsiella ginkgonis]